jgi:RNA polymerase-binding protein DksA
MDTEHFRKALLEERKRVEDAIEYLKKETNSLEEETEENEGGVDNHLADQASPTLDRELDYTLEENAEQVLEQIDAALARIEARTYGICEVGGEPIPEDRLEARPWATLCIEHQRQLERG